MLPTNKCLEPDGFKGELTQTFKEKLTSTLLKTFKNFQKKEFSSFYEATIPLMPKSDNDTTGGEKKKSYRPISLMYMDTKYQQTGSKNSLIGSHIMIKWDSSQEYEDTSINVNQSI